MVTNLTREKSVAHGDTLYPRGTFLSNDCDFSGGRKKISGLTPLSRFEYVVKGTEVLARMAKGIERMS
jgi:hypothetical protein